MIAASDIASLDDLYRAFDSLSMEGGWHRRQPALWPAPVKNFRPAQWRYAAVKPILEAAGRLISTDQAERRNLTMTNPVEGNIYPTLRTIVAAYQMIRPGEIARAHRHTPNALRLILEGRGTSTVVNGVRVPMNPGDVLLTPSWSWHSHENGGNGECYWLDFLDVPLVHLLEPMFFEGHPQGLESGVRDMQRAPIAFPWSETLERLDSAQAARHNLCEREIELGSPALATIALHIQRLAPNARTRLHRTTANNVFAVIDGFGRTRIDGQWFDWSFGDVVAVPAWRPYQHETSAIAHLLRVSDAPTMRSLGFLREAFDDED